MEIFELINEIDTIFVMGDLRELSLDGIKFCSSENEMDSLNGFRLKKVASFSDKLELHFGSFGQYSHEF